MTPWLPGANCAGYTENEVHYDYDASPECFKMRSYFYLTRAKFTDMNIEHMPYWTHTARQTGRIVHIHINVIKCGT